MMLGPLMIDIAGTTLTPEDKKLIQHPFVGGLIFFTRNYESPAQIQNLVQEIRAVKPGILLAVDQEGGRVQRFRTGMTALPPVGNLSALYDRHPVEARKMSETLAWLMATEILSLGIDISFAPILDLNLGLSEVIGNRSFHASPEGVIELAGAYIQGMLYAGMQPVGKHFPGHGSVAADSHLALPQDHRTLEEVAARDLKPFEALSTRGLTGMMTAHIIYPNIDPHLVTFSSFWLKTQLRQHCHFRGCIFSDDLTMQGAVEFGSIGTRVASALAAGCDMALICNQREVQKEAIAELEKNGWQVTDDRNLVKMRGKKTLPFEKLPLSPNYVQAKNVIEAWSLSAE